MLKKSKFVEHILCKNQIYLLGYQGNLDWSEICLSIQGFLNGKLYTQNKSNIGYLLIETGEQFIYIWMSEKYIYQQIKTPAAKERFRH